MTNFSVVTVARGKNDPPFNPYVYVVLSDYFSDSKGNITLTPKLMSDMEIDEFIDLRIMQLNKVRNIAKKKLQKTREKR